MKYVPISQVARIERNAASDEECEKLPYVGLDDIEKETGHFANGFEPSPEEFLATKYHFTAQHVLYGKLRPYLNKVALPEFEGVCTTEILPILPIPDKLDRTYLWSFLLTPRFVKWASLNVSGANLPRLSPKDLAAHKIPLPPLDEQKHIAAILARADRLRRLTRYGLEMSESYLQAVFVEMFGDPVTNPMGWEFKTLGSLKTRFKYGTSVKCDYEPAGLPVLRIPNILSGEIDLDDLKYGELSSKEVQKLQLKKGDLLFVRTNGNPDYVGRSAVFDLDIDCLFASYLIRARLKTEALSPVFLSAFLKSSSGREFMAPSIRTTAGQYNINTEGLGAISVPLPPLDLQQRFADIVRRFERVRAQQREQLRQAEHLFGSLLARAFGGGL